jgi:translation initiation factor IF-1
MTSRDTALTAMVTESLPNKRYLVRLTDGSELHTVASPRCKGRRIEPGQTVTVEFSASDPSLCRIRSDSYRLERPRCRVGVAPTEDPRLFTAHNDSRPL